MSGRIAPAPVALRRRAQAALHGLGVFAHPSGQYRDEDGVLWTHTDERAWLAGGHGSPMPDLDDATTVLALLARVEATQRKLDRPVGELAELGDRVASWLAGRVRLADLAADVVARLEHQAPDSPRPAPAVDRPAVLPRLRVRMERG